jgi:2-oxo-4-hydroxy-4-carboxy--5-ureidoimidazoline (OHCU) decarboxylase
MALPSIPEILSNSSKLNTALSILFEPSPILTSNLVPQIFNQQPTITSYVELISIAINIINSWNDTLRAEFVAGHPRIGEIHNLSSLSAKEQGESVATTATTTPPDVLSRLVHLNACYEWTYPGLRYITFVDGRSRADIVIEMENVLGIGHSMASADPPLVTFEAIDVGSDRWRNELNRATEDVGKIAKNRLKALQAA